MCRPSYSRARTPGRARPPFGTVWRSCTRRSELCGVGGRERALGAAGGSEQPRGSGNQKKRSYSQRSRAACYQGSESKPPALQPYRL
ncbi:hypothetical protein NN561_018632 [Cricetulus griseus]